jgi:hypothetical protein
MQKDNPYLFSLRKINMMEIWKDKDTVSVSESKFLKHKRIIILTNIAICKITE